MRRVRPIAGPAKIAAVVLCARALYACALAYAAPSPATLPATMPALNQLEKATRELYGSAQTHLVHVRVPVRILSDHPLVKWQSQLDRTLRDQLEMARVRGQSPNLYVSGDPNAARIPLPAPTSIVLMECAGLVVSTHGDVLLPLFIDPGSVTELAAQLPDEKLTTARVQEADRLTGLTIVRMAEATGKPVSFAKGKPAAGSIVLMMAPTQRAVKLAVWTGEPPDGSAIIMNSEAELALFIRNGHAFYPSAFLPIVEQLLSSGEVRRPEMGMHIEEIPLNDARRLKVSKWNAQTAVWVRAVFSDSPAAKGGVHADDLILSLAGESVTDIATFAAALANRRGATEVHVLRDGAERSLSIDLRPR